MNAQLEKLIVKHELENLKWQIERVWGKESRIYGNIEILEKAVLGREPVGGEGQ